MRDGRASRLAASPVLVGAMTVLIAIVTVFLAYQANQGLPFVPTYRLTAEVPNAGSLVPGNEVRIGGLRVGLITDIVPVAHDDGTVSAEVEMDLQQDLQPLPVDTNVIVRARSALGLKYLEIRRGSSDHGFAAGAVMPLSAARPEPVEIDEVFNTFDEPTRLAIQQNLAEFGNALAGRGPDLNAAIGDLKPLVTLLAPVMKNLASPDTDLRGFVTALADTAAEVAPVAEQQGVLFADLERTFGAFAAISRPYLQDTISKSPATEDTVIDTLPRIRPFLANTAGLFGDLQPGAEALRASSDDFAAALGAGIKALRASPSLNAQLPPTTQSLVDLSNDSTSREGLDDLITFNNVLAPPLAFITPAQSVCNYASLLFRNTSDVASAGDSVGTNQRAIVLAPPLGPNSESGPSSAPANGGGDRANFLHFNPYPNTASPGQTRECEAGNEAYLPGRQVIGNEPGSQGIVTDEQIPAQIRAGGG